MKLSDKNEVCFFCEYSSELHEGIVWCRNKEKILENRQKKYGTKRVSALSGETRFANYFCDGYKEQKGAAVKLVQMKLTGKYRKHDHEK